MKKRIRPPNNAMARAVRSFQTGQHKRASGLCQIILCSNPEHTEALTLLGIITAMAGELAEAIRLFRRAVDIQPDNAALNKNLARTLMSAGKGEEGTKYYSKVVSLLPGDGDAHYDFACACQRTGNPAAAESHFRRALSINPRHIPALTNLGSLLRGQARHEQAIECYTSVLKIAPGVPEALVGLGLTQQERGCIQEAEEILDRAVKLYPNDADAHVNRAICSLIKGDYSRGWQEYQWRWRREDKQRRDFTLPIWDGTSLSGRGILVYAEQGIGDEIMFASCLPDICAQADHVIIDCEPRLKPLFARSFPRATVHGGYQNESGKWLNDISGVNGVNVQIPIGSLPLYLRSTEDSFAGRKPYLEPDPDVKNDWQERLNTLNSKPKIGISWKGGGTALVHSQRSIKLSSWETVLQHKDMCFINLQYGNCQEELRQTREQTGITIHDFPELNPLAELDSFAALISALDLVISIDNSTVHLAGALGVPVWLLLPPVPDWRWTMSGEHSLWYPSLRLFRKTRGQKWGAVLRKASAALDGFIIGGEIPDY